MNFAKKTLSFALATVMAATSLISGITAFADTGKINFTAINGNSQAIGAVMRKETDEKGNTNYSTDTDGYYTYIPAQTGYYAICANPTPIYKDEKANSYSYTQTQDSKRVDLVSFSVYSKYDSVTNELSDCLANDKSTNYILSYKQEIPNESKPVADKTMRIEPYVTVKLNAGQTYYISTYTPGFLSYNKDKNDYDLYSGATLTITPSDWNVIIKSDIISSQTFKVKENNTTVEEEYLNYRHSLKAEYVGQGKDVKVPEKINNLSVSEITGTQNNTITSLTLSKNVESVSGFENITTLSKLDLASVKTIKANAFKGCTALKEVVIPSGTKEIGKYAFNDCYALSKLTISNGVKSIGEKAFLDTSLKKIIIPASVNNIEQYAFGYTTDLNLNTVYPYDTTEILNKNFVMGGYSNYEVQRYAKENGITYLDMTNGCPHYYKSSTTQPTLFTYGKTTSVCALCENRVTKSLAKKKINVSSLKAGKRSFTVKTAKQSGIKGYQIQYSTSKSFTKKTTKTVKVSTTKGLNKTVKNLKRGKKYYVRVRAYKTSNKKTVYSSWSASKNIKVK